MAINFPSAPSVGQTYTFSGRQYTWDGEKWGLEVRHTSVIAATPPSSPINGQLWLDTDSGGLFCYLNDGDSSQWIEIAAGQNLGSAYIIGGTDIALADGGTGASLADPNADRIMFWDDSAGQMSWLEPSGNLSISGTTLSALPTLGTAVAITGSSPIDYTGIPSWARRITIIFENVSLSGTDSVLVQLGDSGGFETTGYTSYSGHYIAGPAVSIVSVSNGFNINLQDAGRNFYGTMTLFNNYGNSWVSTMLGAAAGTNTPMYQGGGRKELSATLDRLRITVSGANTFDSGAVNIIYE